MRRSSSNAEVVLLPDTLMDGVHAMASSVSDDPFEVAKQGGLTARELRQVVEVTGLEQSPKAREILRAARAMELMKLLGISAADLQRFVGELGIDASPETEFLVKAAKTLEKD